MSGVLFTLFAVSIMLFYGTFNYLFLLKKIDKKFPSLRTKLVKRTLQFGIGALSSLLVGIGIYMFM